MTESLPSTSTSSATSTRVVCEGAARPEDREPRRPRPATPHSGGGASDKQDSDEGATPPIDQDMDLPGMDTNDDEHGRISPPSRRS